MGLEPSRWRSRMTYTPDLPRRARTQAGYDWPPRPVGREVRPALRKPPLRESLAGDRVTAVRRSEGRVPMYTITATAPPVRSQGKTLRDMAMPPPPHADDARDATAGSRPGRRCRR